ncbi:hypothetical protein Goari_022536 [Gossypium aridum]|uniref:Uncharacterized protein n=1 Tax=Gossypium aridum TaxID=34290 RepID=A0A7J8YS44_GOSAI|nr:hypothetical protein [Gossypium aridum]
MGVTMKEGVLDPTRHTIIVFKENKDSNLTGVVEGGCSKLLGNEAIHLCRFRVDGRALGYRKGMRLKKTISGLGEYFQEFRVNVAKANAVIAKLGFLFSYQLFDGYMSDTLSCLSMEVKKWNRVVYSHIGTRKRHIVNRLADIQKVMERPDELGFYRELGKLGFLRGPGELVFASGPSKLRLPMGLASCNHWFGPSELRFC